MIRINKYLSQSGVASRRNADLMVAAGRVTVNGIVITALGQMVDETSDQVAVDGRPVTPAVRHTHILLNKPGGYVTTRSDPHHKRTVMELLKDLPDRVNPVGRLDLDTTGVLLFTNDGELAHRLTHPRFGVTKVYRATVAGDVSKDKALKLSGGVALPDGSIGRAQASIEEKGEGVTVLCLELTEGHKREVKHLCKAIGHAVISLERRSFAGLDAAGVALGKWRYLTTAEIERLRRLVRLDTD
jgi:23S rRNA pseudouridine2605 synthase